MSREESDTLIHHVRSEICVLSMEQALYLNKQEIPETESLFPTKKLWRGFFSTRISCTELCTILDLIPKMQQRLEQLLLHSSLTSVEYRKGLKPGVQMLLEQRMRWQVEK